jgi:hypothetical protein
MTTDQGRQFMSFDWINRMMRVRTRIPMGGK